LIPLGETGVHVPTKKAYLQLMRIYELGDLRWGGGELPTRDSYWEINRSKTILFNTDSLRYGNIDFHESSILKPKEFYEAQKITVKKIFKANYWFDEILPLIKGVRNG
jgi:hypothetical protein|tara:strand:+ start:12034 stop:12357 length:324 start_codon:yes stop_codon:yes gene_type:complete